MKQLIKPDTLKSGDAVRLVASSSSFDRNEFLQGVKCLRDMGLKVLYQKNIFAKLPYLAGSDRRRFTELKSALEDDRACAIFFARGGYGAMRLMPHLMAWRGRPHPKIILGYSDITTLLLYFQKRFGWSCFYGPVVAADLVKDSVTTQCFRRAVFENRPLGELKAPRMIVVRAGKATAPVVGGCLTLLAASLGTDYPIEADGKILFMEDVNEKPYRIDRLLMQLKLAGVFEKCRGVVFGSLDGPNPLKHYAQVMRDIFSDYSFPVVMNFPAGHSRKKYTLPLGITAELDTRRKSLNYLESALK